MTHELKGAIKRVPLVGSLARKTWGLVKNTSIATSTDYWESRYATGGTSGPGSSGKLAEFKAEVLNSFVRRDNVLSVIEFGCGDGNQLSLASYPDCIACHEGWALDP